MGQIVMEWLKKEPTELHEYIVLSVMIFFFGIVFAGIGFFQLGRSPGEAMFRRTLTVVEHGRFAAACKLIIFVIGQDCVYWFLLLGSTVQVLESDWRVLASAVPISVLFGIMPPHNALPKKRTLVAAALGGFILALLYLKCGGWSEYSAKALVISSVAHLWVTGIIVIAFVRYRKE